MPVLEGAAHNHMAGKRRQLTRRRPSSPCAGDKSGHKPAGRHLEPHDEEGEEDDVEDEEEDVQEKTGDEDWRPPPGPGCTKKMGQLRVPGGTASVSTSNCSGKGGTARGAATLTGLPPRGKKRSFAADITNNTDTPGGGARADDSDPLLDDWTAPVQFKVPQAPAKKGNGNTTARAQAAPTYPTLVLSPGAGAGQVRPSEDQTEPRLRQVQQQQTQQSQGQWEQQQPRQTQQNAQQRQQQVQQKPQLPQHAQMLLAQRLHKAHQSERSRAAFGDCFPSQPVDPFAPPWVDELTEAASSPHKHQLGGAPATQAVRNSSGLTLGVDAETAS